MTREEYEKEYDAIDTTHPDNDDGSITMFLTRDIASNLRVLVCQKYITSLEARIAELEAENAKLRASAVTWQVFDVDDCNTYPQIANMYLTLSRPERTEYREIDNESTYDVLWWELYSEEYWAKHGVTHYAILPELPEVKE